MHNPTTDKEKDFLEELYRKHIIDLDKHIDALIDDLSIKFDNGAIGGKQ